MLFLIDAYNVIFNSRKLQKLALSDSPAARKLFIEMIADFCEREDDRAIIVFDGGGSSKVRCFINNGLVKAYFSGGKADPFIMRMAPVLFRCNPDLHVVSSDSQIRGYCGQMGIKTVGAMKFRREYLRSQASK